MASIYKRIFLVACMVYSSTMYANGVLFKIPTRPEVTTTLFWEPVDQAKATVLLFPGGGGGFGKIDNGKPGSNNSLVRSESYFISLISSMSRFLAAQVTLTILDMLIASVTHIWWMWKKCWSMSRHWVLLHYGLLERVGDQCLQHRPLLNIKTWELLDWYLHPALWISKKRERWILRSCQPLRSRH